MPAVTCIVLSYNHAPFLAARLQSVFNQTFDDYEVLILDDASTDQSREIIENYRNHPRLKRIEYADKNSGSPIHQWIKGIALAESEWVWIAESDDYCAYDFLEKLSPVFWNNEAVIGLSEIDFVDEHNQVISRFISIGKQWWHGVDFLNQHMLQQCYICNAGMAVFRKSAVQLPQHWQADFSYGPDYFFWCSLVRQGQVFSCGEVLAHFRKHHGEFTSGKVDSVTDHREHTLILRRLFSDGLVEKRALKAVVADKLVTLGTRKNGMEQSRYDELAFLWRALAKQCRIYINPIGLRWQIAWRKLRHRIIQS